jgi:hypothetical protein
LVYPLFYRWLYNELQKIYVIPMYRSG